MIRVHRDLVRLLHTTSSPSRSSTDAKGHLPSWNPVHRWPQLRPVPAVDDSSKTRKPAGLARAYLPSTAIARRKSGKAAATSTADTGGDTDNLMIGRNGVFVAQG